MKRILTTAALLAAIALPAAANGQADSASKVARGAQLEIGFTLETVGNKPVAIKDFEFKGLSAICDGGGTAIIKGHINAIRVRDNKRFAATVNRNGKKVRVAGRVRSAKVVGTIRASGDYGQQTNCNSGRVKWVAQ